MEKKAFGHGAGTVNCRIQRHKFPSITKQMVNARTESFGMPRASDAEKSIRRESAYYQRTDSTSLPVIGNL
jgi:hypothetical protein